MQTTDSLSDAIESLREHELRWAITVALLAATGAAVGYEVGSVAAGAPLEPLWLVPILGTNLTILVVMLDDAGGD